MEHIRFAGIYTKTSFGRPVLTTVLLIMVMLLSVSSHAKEKFPTFTLLVWGDSLSAAYGIPVEKGWVQLLQNELPTLKVINGSISGETTQGGLNRLPAALKIHSPDWVLIALGANDALRGLPIATIKSNLLQMIAVIKAMNAKAMIIGMKIPINYGLEYTQQFSSLFHDIAKAQNTVFIPFFLENIANDYTLMQQDGLHPTAEAQHMILKQIKPIIEQQLRETTTQSLK